MPVSADDFPALYAAAWCGMFERCCQFSGGTSEGTCTADIGSEVTARGTQAAADGAIWNGDVAARCLDAIEGADCAGTNTAALLELVATCDDTWSGVIPPGGPCQYHESCAEPPVSGGASAGASCVNGMCAAVVRLPAGAECSELDPLQVCNPTVAECVSGICEALPEDAQPCTDSCRPGSRCRDGMCEALLAGGETCAADNECASDRCSAGQCASSFVETEYCTLP
jgi:hypothetical protein